MQRAERPPLHEGPKTPPSAHWWTAHRTPWKWEKVAERRDPFNLGEPNSMILLQVIQEEEGPPGAGLQLFHKAHSSCHISLQFITEWGDYYGNTAEQGGGSQQTFWTFPGDREREGDELLRMGGSRVAARHKFPGLMCPSQNHRIIEE